MKTKNKNNNDDSLFEKSWEEFFRLYKPYCMSIIINYNMQSYKDELFSNFLKRILDLTNKNQEFYIAFINRNCPKAFIRRIIINLIYDHLRKINSEKIKKIPYELSVENILDSKLNISESDETSNLLKKIYEKCSKIEKEILDFRFTKNQPITFIAKKYNMDRTTMSKKISKICKKLKQELEKNIIGSLKDNL